MDGDLRETRAALVIRPEHVIVRRDRRHANALDTFLDVETVDEVATGHNHRLYMAVVNAPGAAGCVIEADAPIPRRHRC